ncbi:hypothetical protein K443DRAFT_474161 [Laccaria amethystina LaAM-08-1]|jgi:hypothetical protein|uniref:Uncharacterized protein n=1 Tax=Laccaria amethystina LaAM-08-1 TaxID=1095629 RepID=A0A0C9XPS2_9AGAR|nr:hypothetical protein K443DRAFT_474161 [Laccaria amethystina LaAM-08-1]
MIDPTRKHLSLQSNFSNLPCRLSSSCCFQLQLTFRNHHLSRRRKLTTAKASPTQNSTCENPLKSSPFPLLSLPQHTNPSPMNKCSSLAAQSATRNRSHSPLPSLLLANNKGKETSCRITQSQRLSTLESEPDNF